MKQSTNNIHMFREATFSIASEWVAKLDGGELSEADQQRLTEWLQADPLNREALANQLQQWSDMDVLSELALLDLNEKPFGMVARFKQLLPLSGLTGAVVSFASLLVVISWLSCGHFSSNEIGLQLAIETEVGERKSEALPDGSFVHVNTISSAQITYTRDERSVILRSGEAFFDVAPEVDRPFVVYAADTTVRAVGTAFSVYNNNGEISVAVTEGSVEFMSAGISKIIAAIEQGSGSRSNGNVATYRDQHTQVDTQPASEVTRRLSWQDGMLEFRGEPLEYVVQQLSRYTDAQIVIVDDDIKDIRLGGYFKIGDIEGLASTLALGFNIQVDVISEDLIQVSRGEIN
ncbi:MAG: FecR domain-containing protein [Acidiferrobacterales bacterium]|nr:FecR domain-containing protein [Acidiferrobacterales bacterium]